MTIGIVQQDRGADIFFFTEELFKPNFGFLLGLTK